MASFNWPINPTSVNVGPVQYVHDGVDTEVSLDTSTPANSTPLPVLNLDSAGAEVEFATEAKQDTIISALGNIETDVEAAVAELQDIETDVESAVTELQSINTELDTQTTALQSIAAKDFATETTLQTLAKETTLQTIAATDFATETTLSSLESKDFATETTLQALAAEDFATETTLAALSAKVTAVDTDNVTISAALPAGSNNIGEVDVASLPGTVEQDLADLNARLAGSLVPEEYDYIEMTYVDDTTDLNTVVYKIGGSGGATVATLTMGYDSSARLTSVTRT